MPKVILELKNEPKKDDILIFDGKQWVATSKDLLLKPFTDNLASFEKNINNKVNSLMKGVDSKLEDYHNILQVLTKGE